MHSHRATSFKHGDWISETPYRVVRLLGVGGMGEVYEVDHTKTGTRRAIKIVRPSLSGDAVAIRRFVREGRTLRSIEHPNVVRVFETGRLSDCRPYFTMELLEGMSFKRLAKRAPLSIARCAGLAVQALDGLSALHYRGFVHRDVKPSNLFLGLEGNVSVLDLGIVKSTDPHASAPGTQVGMVIGTTRYMSPEQVKGYAVDARTDVYAVALVLFELATGKHPFDVMIDGQGLDRFDQEPPSVSAFCASPSAVGFEAIVKRAMAVEPDHRFESAEAFARALRPLASHSIAVSRRPRLGVRVKLERRLSAPEGSEETTRLMPPKSKGRVEPTRRLEGLQAFGLVMSLLALIFAVSAAWLAARLSGNGHGSVCAGAVDVQTVR